MKDKQTAGRYWFHITQDNSVDRIYKYRWIVGLIGYEIGFSRGDTSSMWEAKRAIKKHIKEYKNPKQNVTWRGTL